MSVLTSLHEVVSGQNLETPTWVTSFQGLPRTVNVRRCRLEVVAGVDAGKIIELAQPTIMIGRAGADLNLNDPKVSGLHCELRLQADGYRIRDLGSTNGTHVKGVRIVDGFIAPGSTIQIGKSAITFDPLDDAVAVPLWHESRLHSLIGGSASMRHLFDLINRFAQSDATVLIQGETGAGKEGVADAIHQCSPRREGPFVVLDCSAIPEQLFEDQIFGHEHGAFTGAGKATIGVFEAAHGGTLFLDEIGELPLDVQSKLLRAVETRKIRRIGSTKVIACDVRIIAATNRDLAAEVNRGTFRSDLFYRLSVAKLAVPALRERKEDLQLLVQHFLRQLVATHGDPRLPDDFMARAQRHTWPGNVRELRNAVERAVLLPNHPTGGLDAPPKKEGTFGDVDIDIPFKTAKQQLVDEFDRRYLEALLEAHDNNISAAARAAGIERMSIYKMIRRLGLDDGAKKRAPTGDDDESTGEEI
ncbi:MAG: sigma54 specific transcriptional regulator, Fis family [Myxococcales bacterium]|nr:sigma54 specific transcriptional regulator, Fis family [Myxococcales bacterium]